MYVLEWRQKKYPERRSGMMHSSQNLIAIFLFFFLNDCSTVLSFHTNLSALRIPREFSCTSKLFLNFKGCSSSSITVTLPPHSSRTLPQFLASTDSDIALLGTDSILRPDGLYDCPQPSTDWFGFQLNPTFVFRIHRIRQGSDSCPDDRNGRCGVEIIDTRTDVKSGGFNPLDLMLPQGLVSGVSSDVSFKGGTLIQWREVGDNSFSLSSKLSLTMALPLPEGVPLPPGFERIGSEIIRVTCEKRVAEHLRQLGEEYCSWAAMSSSGAENWIFFWDCYK